MAPVSGNFVENNDLRRARMANPITPDAAVDGAGIWGRFQELPLEQAEEALVMPEKL